MPESVETWMLEHARPVGRVGDRVVEHNGLFSWWRCETCGRTGQANRSNEHTVHSLKRGILKKAKAHRCR